MKSLKRLLIISTVAVSFIGINESSVLARNNKCVKVGTFKTTAQVKYECKRLTTGLRWIKVQTEVVPTVPAEIIISIPTDWSNIEKYAENIPYASWKASVSAITNGIPQMPKLNIINGSNAVVTNASPETAINLASRLFSAAAQPTQLTIMRFGYEDTEWARAQWVAKFGGQDDSVPSEVQSSCATPTTCWGGTARITSNDEAWILLATMKANTSSSGHVTGALEAHEYVHTIQAKPFSGVKGRTFNHLPRWLLEGMAAWSQAAVLGVTSFDAYKAERTREVSNFKNSVAWLEAFLAPTGTNWAHWNSYTGNDSWRIYDVGFLATEALVALKGPNTVMSLYAKVGSGQTFDQAFNELYGISWVEAHKIIARVISLQINK